MKRYLICLFGLMLTGAASAGWQLQWIERFDGEAVNWDNSTAQVDNAQGLTLDYMAFADLLFVAWFTYDSEPPASDAGEVLDEVGALDNRWMTATLSVDGNAASGPIYTSTGGRFDAPPQPDQESVEVGSMTIEFGACDRATVSYEIDGTSLAREFPVIPLEQRVNGAFRCDSQASM